MIMKKNRLNMVFAMSFLSIGLCSCENTSSSSNSNEYIEERVVTSDTYVDGNGEISFRGGSVKTVWKDKWKEGHQFRATIKSGHYVVKTTKCDACGHMYYVHYDK